MSKETKSSKGVDKTFWDTSVVSPIPHESKPVTREPGSAGVSPDWMSDWLEPSEESAKQSKTVLDNPVAIPKGRFVSTGSGVPAKGSGSSSEPFRGRRKSLLQKKPRKTRIRAVRKYTLPVQQIDRYPGYVADWLKDPPRNGVWSSGESDLIQWFFEALESGGLPTVEFRLNSYSVVVNPERWYAEMSVALRREPCRCAGRRMSDLMHLQYRADGIPVTYTHW